MTLQEIFTKVATHLLAQKAKSRASSDGPCAYRGAEGRQCAAGALIPDALYTRAIEGLGVCNRRVTDVLVAAGVVPQAETCSIKYEEDGNPRRYYTELQHVPHLLLIRELQLIHDCKYSSDWADALAKLAAEKGLVMP